VNAPSSAVIATLLLLSHGHQSSAQGQPRWACHGKTTIAIEQCFRAELSREDDKLRAVSARIRATIDTSARALMDSAGVAWGNYRDAQCMSVYRSYTGGSVAGMQLLACKIALTQERRRTLTNMYTMR